MAGPLGCTAAGRKLEEKLLDGPKDGDDLYCQFLLSMGLDRRVVHTPVVQPV